MANRNAGIVAAMMLFAVAMGFALSAEQQQARPKNWATPIDKPGLPNCHKVTNNLYRGAQ